MPGVTFTTQRRIRKKVQPAYRKYRRCIAALLPKAEIEHIGSTAVAGAVTKGDLDILVRVSRAAFAKADQLLAASFARNLGSLRSLTFSSFKDDAAHPPLGIQLTVRDGPQDNFTKFRDALIADSKLLVRYNQLKRASAGLPMAAYRRRKSKFITEVLAATKH